MRIQNHNNTDEQHRCAQADVWSMECCEGARAAFAENAFAGAGASSIDRLLAATLGNYGAQIALPSASDLPSPKAQYPQRVVT